MADDIVTELRAHRDIDNNRCIECGHWTDHDNDCMVGRAADEIERLRALINEWHKAYNADWYKLEPPDSDWDAACNRLSIANKALHREARRG